MTKDGLCGRSIYTGEWSSDKYDSIIKYCKTNGLTKTRTKFTTDFPAKPSATTSYTFTTRCVLHAKYRDDVRQTPNGFQYGTNTPIPDYHSLPLCSRDDRLGEEVAMVCSGDEYDLDKFNSDVYGNINIKNLIDRSNNRSLRIDSLIPHIINCETSRNYYTNNIYLPPIPPTKNIFKYLPMDDIISYYSHLAYVDKLGEYRTLCTSNKTTKQAKYLTMYEPQLNKLKTIYNYNQAENKSNLYETMDIFDIEYKKIFTIGESLELSGNLTNMVNELYQSETIDKKKVKDLIDGIKKLHDYVNRTSFKRYLLSSTFKNKEWFSIKTGYDDLNKAFNILNNIVDRGGKNIGQLILQKQAKKRPETESVGSGTRISHSKTTTKSKTQIQKQKAKARKLAENARAKQNEEKLNRAQIQAQKQRKRMQEQRKRIQEQKKRTLSSDINEDISFMKEQPKTKKEIDDFYTNYVKKEKKYMIKDNTGTSNIKIQYILEGRKNRIISYKPGEYISLITSILLQFIGCVTINVKQFDNMVLKLMLLGQIPNSKFDYLKRLCSNDKDLITNLYKEKITYVVKEEMYNDSDIWSFEIILYIMTYCLTISDIYLYLNIYGLNLTNSNLRVDTQNYTKLQDSQGTVNIYNKINLLRDEGREIMGNIIYGYVFNITPSSIEGQDGTPRAYTFNDYYEYIFSDSENYHIEKIYQISSLMDLSNYFTDATRKVNEVDALDLSLENLKNAVASYKKARLQRHQLEQLRKGKLPAQPQRSQQLANITSKLQGLNFSNKNGGRGSGSSSNGLKNNGGGGSSSNGLKKSIKK